MSRGMIFAAMLLFSCAALGAARKLIELPFLEVISPSDANTLDVGIIPDGCTHVLNKQGKPAATPPGFSISPDEALKRAIAGHGLRCASKPQTIRLMFANREKVFYTILDYAWLSNHAPQAVFVYIDGRSGRVWNDSGKHGG